MPFNEEQQKQMQAEQEQIKQNIKHIKHQILVLSGKGGVGKSSIAVNLAVWLSMQGKKVGLLDIDIHGPSIPKLLNLENNKLQSRKDKIEPIIDSFLTQRPAVVEIAEEGEANVNAVFLEIDPKSKKAVDIKRVDRKIKV